MRLTHIKLSGFKSFVDPTTIPTPGQMVAVVGPNGCGKSNIMDAVRWVLGESRVSELRGESMQDVIFNGSGSRKPAGRASVELIFDNADGRASGQWSSYAEISVRRILTKDNQSSYLINNQQVRRRDIHDLFLGTGLGTKGYAIIGQGMINRLIEARPEELRVYLEEAAGVSRYKERRREAENRLSGTRDNLQRVEDILRELNAQLAKLESQAEVAAKHQALQEEGLSKQHHLWFVKERAAQQRFAEITASIEAESLKQQREETALQDLESALDGKRRQVSDLAQRLQAEQGRFYECGALVQRIETDIRHTDANRERLQSRQQQLSSQKEDWAQQSSAAEEASQSLNLQLEELEARLMHAEELSAEAAETLPDLEQAVQRHDAQRRLLLQACSEHEKHMAQLEERQRQEARQLEAVKQRLDNTAHQLAQIKMPDPVRVKELEGDISIVQHSIDEQQALLNDNEGNLPHQKALAASLRAEKDEAQRELTRLQSRLEALSALQAQVLSSKDADSWLQRCGISERPKLLELISIEAGWERALEVLLGTRLSALRLTPEELASMLSQAGEKLPQSRLSLFSEPQEETAESASASKPLRPVLDLLVCQNLPLQSLLQGWLHLSYAADSLSDALELRQHLPQGGQLIVPEGHVIDRHSVVFYAADSDQAGALLRQREIRDLERQIKAQRLICGQIDPKLQQAQASLDSTAEVIEQCRKRLSELSAHQNQLLLKQSQYQQAKAQSEKESAQLQGLLEELNHEAEDAAAALESHQGAQQNISEQANEAKQQLQQAEEALQEAAQHLETGRTRMQDCQHQLQALQFDKRSVQTRLEQSCREREAAQRQLQQISQELDSLAQEVDHAGTEEARAQLQDAQENKAILEESLRSLRLELEDAEQALRQTDEDRLRLEQSLGPRREDIMQLRLQAQSAELAAAQHAEQLDAHEVDREQMHAASAELPESWRNESWLQSQIKRISKEIEQLGPVNMAALQELQEARERKGFLDQQESDLLEAISTLEAAIQKIDRETRSVLGETFDQVSGHFSELFPQLFGGGQASLSMTGEEILDAGVQVKAQPPGKKNTTIQLLSGGEKALTAIALVFAFFKLNPAPFCLLDEVDAPLDDANTDRYAKLVKSMSEHTQFLFISHNKIAMKMAQNLVGVTMQEQGVSRIVAVDVESAVQLADPS